MNMDVRTRVVRRRGRPIHVVVPVADWNRIVEAIEDAEDAEAVRAFRESGEETYPAELVHAMIDGANRVGLFRKHRGLTQAQLAKSAGITQICVSQIEAGKRTGSARVLRRLAKALRIDVDLLRPR